MDRATENEGSGKVIELDIRAVHSSLEEQSALCLLLCPRHAEIADIIIPG